ncbi:MAG: DUF1570 domain-containing protein [Pseudomonadaceae bacterium]|nr:DUF1570 domain-containing protein [Pseudomonadaceae bacterium]
MSTLNKPATNRSTVPMFFLAITASLLACTHHATELPKGLSADWIETRSENFTLLSAVSEAKTLELNRHLEAFRAAISVITNIRNREHAIPLRVIVLKGSRMRRALGIDSSYAGLYLNSLRESTIVITNGERLSGISTALHEYLHFLIRNQSTVRYPMWYEEGLAEYLSGVKASRGKLSIGLESPDRRRVMEYGGSLAYESVLSHHRHNDNLDDVDAHHFYAQSWALTMYLHQQQFSGSPLSSRLYQYLKAVGDGSTEREAFEAAFDMPLNAMKERINRFVRNGRYRYMTFDIQELLPQFAPASRALANTEVAYYLSALGNSFGQRDVAKTLADLALQHVTVATDPLPIAARAHASRSNWHLLAGDRQTAHEYITQALALAPDDPMVQFDAGWQSHHMAHELVYDLGQNLDHNLEAGAQLDNASIADIEAHLKAARSHYVAAWKISKTIPVVFLNYALTFTFDVPSQNLATAQSMLKEARHLMPSSGKIAVELADVSLQLGDCNLASRLAVDVKGTGHITPEMLSEADRILTQCEELAQARVP